MNRNHKAAIERYGFKTCVEAYLLNRRGEGASSIALQSPLPLRTTRQADSAINAGRAILDGYTLEVIASCDDFDLYLLIKPGTDLDSTFRAWDTDEQELIAVNGWLFTFEFPAPETETFVDYDEDGEDE